MKVLICGASGFIGRALHSRLCDAGHNVWSLVRRAPRDKEIYWQPNEGHIEHRELEGFDVIIHLAGENIAAQPWSKNRKKKILENREQLGQLLFKTIAKLKQPPQRYIVASAIGFYGNHESKVFDESSSQGAGFLTDVCVAIENAAHKVAAAHIPTTILRFGVVLGKGGGALPKMAMPFHFCAGGPVGHGRQLLSWVSLKDVLSVIQFVVDQKVDGTLNVVAPDVVSNKTFSSVLASVLRRPARLTFPAVIVKILFGEMGKKLLLEGAKVEPKRLKELGYTFQHDMLAKALKDIYSK